jgi:hypothetical protein
MVARISHDEDRENEAERRIAYADIEVLRPQPVALGDVAGEKRREPDGDIAREFVETDGEASADKNSRGYEAPGVFCTAVGVALRTAFDAERRFPALISAVDDTVTRTGWRYTGRESVPIHLRIYGSLRISSKATARRSPSTSPA